MSKMGLTEFTPSELAANCKMDRRTVAKRLSDIVPHRTSGTKEYYYLSEVGRALFHPSPELGGDHLELTQEKARLACAQANKVERENAIKDGSTADMDEVLESWQANIGSARAKMMSLPAQLANRCAGMDRGEIEDTARELVFAALEELSRDGT